ncbi:Benzoylformate decarboxylase [Chaetomidium leptoderma]|uniref:Benzoylformate decarboxylase n=1 Tax=Chaetomidium leptoderma TaxID=669021 RepID=A0AAN6VRD9_9PEZI|nr:Benzoylformate decarboxylase [Chaetomidium leptoderma]
MSAQNEIVYGSDAMVRDLSRLHLPYIALVPGASFRGLHDSIVNFNDNHNPKIILCLHEEHSVAIAHGFAKVTERPMAAVVHDAVGLMHATMAIYNAHCDRSPVLILGGNGPLDATRRRPWIDWTHTAGDEAALIRPFVKFDDQPASVQAAVQSIITATAAAAQIPRGPTYVCLDVALQEDKLSSPDAIHFPATERYMQAAMNPPGPSSQDIHRIHGAILEAKKQPLFLFGRVSRSQKSWNERIRLAERFNARVLTDLKLAAAFPTQHRLHAAPPELFLSEQEIDVIRSADLIVSFDWVDLAGSLKTAFPEDGGGLGEPPASVIVAHITLDHPAIHDGWTKDHFAQPPIDIAISADVDKTVSALLAAAPPEEEEHPPALLSAIPNDAPPRAISQPDPPTPNDDKIFITDLTRAIYTTIPPSQISLLRLPLGFKGTDLLATHPLSHLGQDGGTGTGSGPGNAVGAALALMMKHTTTTHRGGGLGPGLLPVAILGDGDFIMGCTAVWTAVHHDIPLLVVVANNEGFLNDEQHQREVARARGRPVTNAGVGTRIEGPAVDVMGLAVSLGARRVVERQVRKRGELEGVLGRAAGVVRDGGVVVVDVFVWPEE